MASSSSHPGTIEYSGSAAFNLATILQAAQSLSSEIEFDKLLPPLLCTLLKHTEADKGVLLLPDEQVWTVAAIAVRDQPVRLESSVLSSSLEIPQTLIDQVKSSLQSLEIVALVEQSDPYFAQQRPNRLLCTPILRHGRLVAILYLENHATIEANHRLELLNFFCNQAAISLENARLYQQSQEQQQYLRSLYDGVEHLIFVIDVLPDREVRWLGWNAPTEKATGIKSADIFGKAPEEIFGENEGKKVRQNMMNCLEVGAVITYEECLTFNEELTWWLTTLNPLRDENDQIYRIIGTTMSITNLKRTESALRESEAKFQQKANDLEYAMGDLQQAQLQMVQSEKMASLGNLVAGVAHEINNPLGFLNGSINNAKDYVKDLIGHLGLYQQHYPNAVAPIRENAEEIDLEFVREDLPKLLRAMQGATERIKSMSTSLRTFSRSDTEHKVKANLHDGLDSTLLILKYRLKANEFRPEIEMIRDYGDLPLIECFPGQLNQVFMNILANAIDAHDEVAQGTPLAELQANPQKITIQTQKMPENWVEIRLKDNSKGMTDDVKTRVFDHLFTTKGVGKGTGLGLAIARQIIVENHGGTLEVQSELGQGTEFMIRLPLGE